MVISNSERKSQSQWILSSYNSDVEQNHRHQQQQQQQQQEYLDSLDHETSSSIQLPTSDTSTSSVHNFQTANNFLWTISKNSEYYDSIDTNLDCSLYQQNGEDLAEFDSLEKQIDDVSLTNKFT